MGWVLKLTRYRGAASVKGTVNLAAICQFNTVLSQGKDVYMAARLYLASCRYLLDVRVEHVGWRSRYGAGAGTARVRCAEAQTPLLHDEALCGLCNASLLLVRYDHIN